MADNRFFDESSDQSLMKRTIVSKYFQAWAKVIIPTVKRHGRKIAYLDLFAGPGRYTDGTNSTPLLVLEKAIADADLAEMLVTMFNDKDEKNCQLLRIAINALPGINKLKHFPVVLHEEVGSEMVKLFEQMRFVPTLFFVDPWGYKGLSLQLVDAVLKDWGCDCIKKNYKDVLVKLEQEGRIITDPPAASRRCRGGTATFAGHVRVTFKRQGSA